MPSRHAFVYIFANVLASPLITLTAALLHPLLDAQPQGGPGTRSAGSSGSGSAAQGR